jgi:CRP-like cAMP-binding protein
MSIRDISVDDTGDWMYSILRSETFSKLPPASFKKIFMRMELVSVKAGDIILRQGERGDYYYIIEYGRCMVSRIPARGKTPIKLAELGPGEGFGEEALIAGTPRNATVKMLTDGQLIRLKEPDFRGLIKEPLLQAVDCAEASSIAAQGAKWLDITVVPGF